jgi:lipopolysaccharide export system protein LptC
LRVLEKFLLVAAFLVFAALTAWLERGQELPESVQEEGNRNDQDPDYYIENFVSTGLDREGRQYVMEAIRLAHFPIDDTSLVEKPHVIQYTDEAGPRHVYADTGLISADGTEILLTGNVKVIESRSENRPGNVTTTTRMRIKLKDKPEP